MKKQKTKLEKIAKKTVKTVKAIASSQRAVAIAATSDESIRMFRDLLLIRPVKTLNDKTDGGIWIPGNVENEMLFWEVMEVGGGVLSVKKGDQIVTTPKHMGQEFNFNGEDLIVMRERNVWGIIG